MRIHFLTRLTIAVLMLTSSVYGQCRWQGWAELRGDFGNRRSIGRPEVFMPLWQCRRSLVFGTVRVLFDTDENVEGDFGVGLRWLGRGAVVGGYAFADVRCSGRGGAFEQITVGFDGYTECWEARINGYIPVSGSHELGDTAFAEGVIVDGQVLVVGHGNNLERALPGVDGEIGGRWFLCGCVELRGLLGAYYFDRKGYPSFGGPRGRAEVTWMLWRGMRLTVGLEGQYDNIRAGRVFGMARLHVPLGLPRGRCRPRLCCLESRMTHRVERLDVLTAVREGPPCRDLAMYRGRIFDGVVTVDAATPDVPAVVAAAGPDSLVIFDGTLGPIETTDTIAIEMAQVLAGGGVALAVEGETCGPAELVLPGKRPLVERLNILGPVIELDTDGTVAGLSLVGGSQGILVDGVNDVLILQSSVTTLADSAPAVQITNGSLRATVVDSLVRTSGIGSDAVLIEAGSDNAMIRGSLLTTVAGGSRGLSVDSSVDVRALENQIRVSGLSTPAVETVGAARFLLDGDVITTADGSGVVLDGSDASAVLNSAITAGGDLITGVLVTDSQDVTVLQNRVATSGSDSPGVRVTDGSESSVVACNVIVTTGDGEASGVVFDGPLTISTGGILSNTIITEGDGMANTSGPAGVALVDDIENVLVQFNEVQTTGGSAPGIFLLGTDSIQILENVVTTVGEASHGVRLAADAASTNFEVRLSTNTITTSGNAAIGILADPVLELAAQGVLKDHAVDNNVILTGGADALAIEFGDFSDGSFEGNALTTTGTQSDAYRVGQLSSNGAAAYVFNENTLKATGVDSNGLVSTDTSNGLGLDANDNTFLDISNFVVDLDASVVDGDGNTWNEKGGGSLCNFVGGVAGMIDFTSPAGGSCP